MSDWQNALAVPHHYFSVSGVVRRSLFWVERYWTHQTKIHTASLVFSTFFCLLGICRIRRAAIFRFDLGLATKSTFDGRDVFDRVSQTGIGINRTIESLSLRGVFGATPLCVVFALIVLIAACVENKLISFGCRLIASWKSVSLQKPNWPAIRLSGLLKICSVIALFWFHYFALKRHQEVLGGSELYFSFKTIAIWWLIFKGQTLFKPALKKLRALESWVNFELRDAHSREKSGMDKILLKTHNQFCIYWCETDWNCTPKIDKHVHVKTLQLLTKVLF
jgi:hypothetical protein